MQEKALIGACMAQLEKEVPQQFEQTPKCLYFTMQEKTQIDACMKQLEKLYMSWNQVTDISPLAYLDALFIVSMDANGFADIRMLP